MVDGKTGGAFFVLKAKRDEGMGGDVGGKVQKSLVYKSKKSLFICIYANFFVPLQPK
jgi:hypothetical protein